MKKSQKRLLTILGIFFLIWIAFSFLNEQITAEKVKIFLLSFGFFTPIVFIILTASSTVLSFLAAAPFWIAGAWIFGENEGFIYVYLGNLLGHYLNFYLSRKYGEKVIEKVAGLKTLNKVKKLLRIINTKTFLIMRILAGPPSDLLSYASGLSPITTRNYLLITAITFVFNTFIQYKMMYFLAFDIQNDFTVIATSASFMLYIASILYPLYLLQKLKAPVRTEKVYFKKQKYND